jgi:hypothetical protein
MTSTSSLLQIDILIPQSASSRQPVIHWLSAFSPNCSIADPSKGSSYDIISCRAADSGSVLESSNPFLRPRAAFRTGPK